MESNIPFLKATVRRELARLRAEKPSAENAERDLVIWSARYRECVVDGDSMFPGEGTYGSILEAYARREALKQYLEEVRK